MKVLRRFAWPTACGVAVAATLVSAYAYQKDDKDNSQDAKRPKVTLKAQPMISMAPSRVVLTAELVGGAGDLQDYYCPAIEWDWGDGTKSEASNDCQPYEPGKSEIKRRFTVDHVFRGPGNYRVLFRLKQHDKAVGVATAQIQVRPGLRDIGDPGK
jgi:hypothetical protein